jgi:hypothetical protein
MPEIQAVPVFWIFPRDRLQLEGAPIGLDAVGASVNEEIVNRGALHQALQLRVGSDIERTVLGRKTGGGGGAAEKEDE